MSSSLDFADDKYTTVSNIRTRYRVVGHGEKTIVMIHGLAASLEHWYRLVPLLVEDYRLILFDLPGCGKTDKPEVEYTLDFYMSFVETFIVQLQLKNFILMGHSFGGGIALKYAQKYPSVEGLILLSNAGFSRRIGFFLRLLTVPLLNRVLTTFNKNGVRDSLKMNVYNKDIIEPFFVDRMYEVFLQPGFRRALLSTLKFNANFMGIKKSLYDEVNRAIEGMVTPILILWGDSDPILPVQWQSKSFNKLPHSTLKIFKNAGHLLYLEYPQEVSSSIKHWCSASSQETR